MFKRGAFLFLLISLQQAYPQEPILEKLGNSNQWIRLLHYGRVDAPTFYVSPQGKQNPVSELMDFLAKLKGTDEKEIDNSLPCIFPARFKFIQQHFPGQFKNVLCPALDEFKKSIDVHQISVVFASYYSSSPASYFGHTFLLLDKDEKSETYSQLLSHSMDFGAKIPPSPNPFVYAFKGLLGGYPGRFSLRKYHEKLKEYGDIDNRDLWIYPLNLTSKEIDLFIDHLWELGNQGWFDYYFLDENCSYHILGMIEAVKPDVQLLKHLTYFTIPIDTIRALSAEKISTRSSQKLSHEKRLLQQREQLNTKQISNYEFIIANRPEDLTQYDEHTLDFATESMLYSNNEKNKIFTEKEKNYYDKLLTVRSKQRRIKLLNYKTDSLSPEKGHPLSKIRYNYLPDSQSHQLGYIPALHELSDKSTGYPYYSQTNILETVLQVHDERMTLQNLKIFDLKSLPPFNPVSKNFSWLLELEYLRFNDQIPQINLKGGYGYATAVYNEKTLLALLATVQESYSFKIEENFVHYLGSQAFFKTEITENLIFNWTSHYQILSDSNFSPNRFHHMAKLLMAFMDNLALEASFSHYTHQQLLDDQWKFGGIWYF